MNWPREKQLNVFWNDTIAWFRVDNSKKRAYNKKSRMLGKGYTIMKKRKKQADSSQETVLIDGYYLPKTIAQSYEQLRDYCVEEVVAVLTPLCARVYEEREETFCIVGETDTQEYRVEMTPVHVSQIEKAIGTKKLLAYIEETKKEMN